MKTEHALDWGKTAQEISDQFEAGMIQCDRYREALEAIIANEEAYKRGDGLSAHIARSVLGFDAMEAEKRLNGWTPVAKPPPPGHYLTFGSEEGIHTMTYTHKTWFCHGHRETPTHWMPVPEPPTC